MKDGFDIVKDIKALINIPSIIALLDGGKVDMSVKSTAPTFKGVVINALGINNEADQVGFGNINCYAPALQIPIGDNKYSQLPDQQALSNLAKAITPLVDEQYKPTFRCWIEEAANIMQDTDGSYFANVKFRYQSIQSNYTNI